MDCHTGYGPTAPYQTAGYYAPHRGGDFTLIVVLFILLVIIGAGLYCTK
jgi:uncharacterized protein (TIGR01732 family)